MSASAPLLTFDEAQAIGGELHDRWQDFTGSAPLEREDMAWGDIVQFVMRRAGAKVEERGG